MTETQHLYTQKTCQVKVEFWRAREDSNLRPSAPQADALSTELRAREEELYPKAPISPGPNSENGARSH